MFKVEMRAERPVVLQYGILDRQWCVVAASPELKGAEQETAWLINEILDLRSIARNPTEIEYKISHNGKIVHQNLVR